MKTNILLLSLLTVFVFNGKSQMTFDDVTMPAKYTFDQYTLDLNGAGIREKFFLDLYVGGLYLTTSSSNADDIIKADEPMSIKLHIISGLIDSDKMIDAVDDGMEKSTKGNSDKFSKEIAMFKAAFKEEIVVGDIYDIAYAPGQGVLIYKNNKLSQTIPGYDFKQALFGIWLCDDPADDDLKEGMLKG